MDRTTLKELYFHINGTERVDEIKMGDTTQNYVEASVFYDKGGTSLYTYKNYPRGYYITVKKIGRGKDSCGYWTSHTLFANDGGSILLFEVKRQSKTKDTEAIEYFNSNINAILKQYYPDLVLEMEQAA